MTVPFSSIQRIDFIHVWPHPDCKKKVDNISWLNSNSPKCADWRWHAPPAESNCADRHLHTLTEAGQHNH
jgi:hypothetical protein